MGWLDKFKAPKDDDLDALVAASQALGAEIEALREKRKALKVKIDALAAQRAPRGMPAGVVAGVEG
jgi:hypothetical protein